ncbi:MAG: hypothetical protein HHAS10_01310 [Candidatus Altimarinota bacterium]
MTATKSPVLFVSIGDAPLGVRGRLSQGQSSLNLGVSSPQQLSAMIKAHVYESVTIMNPYDYQVDGGGVISGVFAEVFGDIYFDPKTCNFANNLPQTLLTGSKIVVIDTRGHVSLLIINQKIER